MIASEDIRNPLLPPVYDLVWTVLMVLVVVAVITVVCVAIARSRRPHGARRASPEQRLLELDELHARGVITDDERRAARAEALRG